MASTKDIEWFKTNFAAKIKQKTDGTVFDVDMITAIACQETGSLWGPMRKKPSLTPTQIAALCCGDTLDADRGRKAFPRTKADLLAVPNGKEMFDIARAALLEMSKHVPGYEFAKTKPAKFCHGFGVFQYDLQFFLTKPTYFLEKKYESFDDSLDRALGELKTGLKTRGLQNKTSISDFDFCTVAICYNTGGYNPSKGLRQGHQDNGKFYGEFIRDFLALARTVKTPGAPATVPAPAPGTTSLPPATPITATGPFFRVETEINTLRLRSEAKISNPATANVVAEMPDGHVVRSFSGEAVNGFIEVEAQLGGTVFRGFASAEFLVPLTQPKAKTIAAESALAVKKGKLPEANLAHPPGLITKRSAIAGAHSLNEPDMPSRTAEDPDGLRKQLAEIIAYLDTEKATHRRYQPRDGLTFCNIYTHDYCARAQVYLPRVWWNQAALIKIAAGQTLAPKLGGTVDEMRANDLFRWLRDFGQVFGWRRAATLTELQNHANMGGVSLIVARRKEDGRSGHIVMVVPETSDETAKRDSTGNVIMPLQSQAGSVNFRYSRSSPNWWKDARFAESAFWMIA